MRSYPTSCRGTLVQVSGLGSREDTKMLIREVAANVYEISLAWSNAYLLLADGESALIDTGLRKDRDRLLAALAHVGIRSGRLSAVYLTHAHCDHAGNAAFLAARSAQLMRSEERRVG